MNGRTIDARRVRRSRPDSHTGVSGEVGAVQARFVSGLISSDLERGFVIINVALVTFGLWCFVGPVRGQWPSAIPLVWFWVVIELINGIGHPIWTITESRYTPGVATAPFLLFLALYLAWQLCAGHASSSPPPNNRWRGP
jgi:hypothetical protein